MEEEEEEEEERSDQLECDEDRCLIQNTQIHLFWSGVNTDTVYQSRLDCEHPCLVLIRCNQRGWG